MSHDPTAPPAPTPSTKPKLTPQFCFNTSALRDFLRLSRATVDDSLSLHLNSLLQPSRRPFTNPSASTPSPIGGRTRRQISGTVCSQFKEGILFPSWADREEALTYCDNVAASSADADDSTSWGTKPAMRMPSDKMAVGGGAETATNTSPSSVDPYSVSDPLQSQQQLRRPRTFWGREQVPDERTDPYSGKDYSYTHQGRAETLRTVLENERGVERIVRARTWKILGERCLDEGTEGLGYTPDEGHESEWRRWMERRGR